jgi:Spy/CpxP family protein refolding chaperone
MDQLKGGLTDEQSAQIRAAAPARGPRGDGQGPGADRGPGEIISQLGLTPEQAEKGRAIFQAQHEAMQKYRAENAEAMKAAMKRLAEARKSGNAEEIEAAKQELQKLREAAPIGHGELLKQLEGVLTPEQLAKAKELLKDRVGDRPGPRAQGDRPARGERQQGDRPARPRPGRGGEGQVPIGDGL